jgi:gamma-glutamyltranspeptidase / glutathione hydrolase
MASGVDRQRESVAVIGPQVVTSGHAAASAAGVAAFAQGGNAFDAALAACFMEDVALPMKCGLGGDVVALFRRAGGAFQTLISVGPGAAALTKGATIERLGPRSVGVPGAPHGYVALHGFARLGLARLTAPAIRAAEEGIAWNWLAQAYLLESLEILGEFSPHNPYQPAGRLPEIGEIRRLPGLGLLYRQFAESAANLYLGPAGETLISELSARGGILTMADLKASPCRIGSPDAIELSAGRRLLVTPAPTGGPRLGTILRRALERGRPLVELVKAERAETKAQGRVPLDAGTSVVTAADDEGNMVVVVHSNSFPRFGSGIVLKSGLVLNNRPGRGFDLTAPANARNTPAAGRVPETTLHAWAFENHGMLVIGATPGGINQLPWNAQALVDLAAGVTPAEAVTNPRWAMGEGDVLSAEEGTPLPEGMRPTTWLARFSHRSAQQLIQPLGGNMLMAAADPRAGAVALASY